MRLIIPHFEGKIQEDKKNRILRLALVQIFAMFSLRK